MDRLALVLHGIVLQHESDLLGHPFAPVQRSHGQQHQELLTAEAGDAVGGAQSGAQATGDVLQDTVAQLVAMSVVDRLEVVDVQHEEGQRFTRAGSGQPAAFLEEGAEKVPPVEQSGQFVGGGQPR